MSLQGKVLNDVAALDNDIAEATFTLVGTGTTPTMQNAGFTFVMRASTGYYFVARSGSEYQFSDLVVVGGPVIPAFKATTNTMLAVTASSDDSSHVVECTAFPDEAAIFAPQIDGVALAVFDEDGVAADLANGEVCTVTIYYKASGLSS